MSFLNKSLILVAFLSLFLVLKPFQNYSAKLREELPQIIPPPLSEEENSSEKIKKDGSEKIQESSFLNPKKKEESKKNKKDQSQTSASKTNNSESESKKEGEKENKDQNQPNIQSSFSPSSPPPDIVSELPRGEFISPQPNDTLNNQVFISFKIEKAQNVEFYLRIPSSLMPTYLGNAFFENGLWNYLWETTKTPNGHYFILAKITSEFGEYWGAKVPIQIKNLVAENLPEVEKIKEKVKQKKRGN